MNRSDFLRLSAAAALYGAAVPLPIRAAARSTGDAPLLTILHTNDTHARHEPFPAESFAHAGLGGALRRARLIDAIRSEAQPVLLLDAGDLLQGTPWFTAFRGRLEARMMAAMGYDAIALGNHEFDLGVAELAAIQRRHRLPFVCANYEFSGTPLAPHVRKYTILTTSNGLRVGVFGLGVDLDGLLDDEHRKGVLVRDPYIWASSMVRILRGFQRCDLVVCLSHLGLRPDRPPTLGATSSPVPPDDTLLVEKVAGLDLVIGGHTHTFLDEPMVRTDPSGRRVPIVQVGHGGIRLGRFDLYPAPGFVPPAPRGLLSRLTSRRSPSTGAADVEHPPVPSYRWRQYEIAETPRELLASPPVSDSASPVRRAASGTAP